MVTKYPVKTEAMKDAIIQQAKQVCKWVGWIEDPRAQAAVEELKRLIQAATGAEIEEYT